MYKDENAYLSQIIRLFKFMAKYNIRLEIAIDKFPHQWANFISGFNKSISRSNEIDISVQ